MRAMSRPEITSTVAVQALPEHTDPAQQRWAFAYTVSIRNTGTVAAQVVGRQWLITDHRGQQQQVRGLGVVGKQPLLQPGEQFEYSSWTLLATAQGTMQGTFYCITDAAEWFEASVPEFLLADTSTLH